MGDIMEKQQITQQKSSEEFQPPNLTENGSMTPQELGKLADKHLELIAMIKESYSSDDEDEKIRLISLYNKLSSCYLQMGMPHHALIKMREIEGTPGINADGNSNFLFTMSDIHCKLGNYKEALECCHKLKKFDKPSEHLDKVIAHLNSKIDEEFNSGCEKIISSLAKSMAEIKLPTIPIVKPDIVASNLPSLLEPLDKLKPASNSSLNTSITRNNSDAISILKIQMDQRKISTVDYEQLTANPFKIRCSVKYKKNGQDHAAETFGEGKSLRSAKHSSAEKMLEKLKELKAVM